MAIPVLSAAEMRAIDARTIEEIGLPGPVLMELAGRACAEEVEALLPARGPARVAVVCGRGNNGGDGLVAARHLRHAGREVDVFLLARPEDLGGDALLNLQIFQRCGFSLRSLPDEPALEGFSLEGYAVILDAVLGTGLSSPVGGHLARAIQAMRAARQAGARLVAVDVPSGVSADTGQVLGLAAQADRTVTFGAPKRGHLLHPGAELSGEVVVADLGFPPGLLPKGTGATWLLDDADLAPYLTRRAPAAHKGDFGHLLVIAGSADKPGAAGLCCLAALRAGAGRVTLAAPPEVLARALLGPTEAMGQPAADVLGLRAACQGKDAVALGPGLGMAPEAAEAVRLLAAELPQPLVVDADGLNHLVGQLELVRKAAGPRVLTPHPGEAARLLARTAADIQADRLGAARQLAAQAGAVVVLKGAHSVVADPDGTAFLVPTGNPGMATAGSGDVLTGVLGALLGQGLGAAEAACVGAFLHGRAGDLAAAARGQRGLVAGDIAAHLPDAIRRFEAWSDEPEEEAASGGR
ncbi:MAG TPA: NAD(P)H-hydrate dehydratase [Myxococcota bacterium]|nr:NAD(P)H-hydrate dehydratase [Myxococcota bacterium]HRY93934.1 NAD(P)H-hydrate dehydratase [Myxococcota bacterium]HSA23843.1 NAD(P)H-hydrate dehydratase [Myxococcota bacterium]